MHIFVHRDYTVSTESHCAHVVGNVHTVNRKLKYTTSKLKDLVTFYLNSPMMKHYL